MYEDEVGYLPGITMWANTLPAIVRTLTTAADPLPRVGFRPAAWFDEQGREEWVAGSGSGTSNHLGPVRFEEAYPAGDYAKPNGSTVEQTLGCASADSLDWRYDTQHVAAQIRTLREKTPDENVVLVYRGRGVELAGVEAQIHRWSESCAEGSRNASQLDAGSNGAGGTYWTQRWG